MRSLVLVVGLLLAAASAKPQAPYAEPIVGPGAARLVFALPPGQAEHSLAVVQRRLAGRRATVSATADSLVVELPAASPDDLAAVRAIVARRGHLDLLVADTLPAAVQAHVERQPSRGISLDVARWTMPDGVLVTEERFLRGQDASALAAYLEALPAGLVPADRRLLRDTDQVGPRSHTVVWPSTLPPDFLAGVTLGDDPGSPNPLVQLQPSEAGIRALADLTSKNIGRRVLVVLDDEVLSAALLMGVIDRGPVLLPVSAAQQVVAVPVLLGGELPAPLVER